MWLEPLGTRNDIHLRYFKPVGKFEHGGSRNRSSARRIQAAVLSTSKRWPIVPGSTREPQCPSVQATLDQMQCLGRASTDAPVVERCSQEPPRLYLPSRWIRLPRRQGLEAATKRTQTAPQLRISVSVLGGTLRIPKRFVGEERKLTLS